MGPVSERTLEAFYPAVAMAYFAALAWGTRQNKLRLDSRASVTVALVFLLGQVVCRALGGVTGFAAFVITAYASYQTLPRVQETKARGAEKPRRREGHKSDDPTASSKKAVSEGKRRERKKQA